MLIGCVVVSKYTHLYCYDQNTEDRNKENQGQRDTKEDYVAWILFILKDVQVVRSNVSSCCVCSWADCYFVCRAKYKTSQIHISFSSGVGFSSV